MKLPQAEWTLLDRDSSQENEGVNDCGRIRHANAIILTSIATVYIAGIFIKFQSNGSLALADSAQIARNE